MDVGSYSAAAVASLIAILSAGVAWGKLGRGQMDLGAKLSQVETRIENRLRELAEELRGIPGTYVRTDVDIQRAKLMDERDLAIRSILNDIREELRNLRHGRYGDMHVKE